MSHSERLGWSGAASVLEWLTAEPHRFEFIQAVRLLESNRTAHPAKLRARGQFAFPASEVRSLESGDGGGTEIAVAFLSLDGAFGPLPSAYSEELVSSEPRAASGSNEFLDLFHHRLLRLLYSIAETHRPALNAESARPGLGGILKSIAGLGVPGLANRLAVPDASLVRYAGLLGRDVRSAHGLERILADYTGLTVAVHQFAGGWLRLAAGQRARLGTGAGASRLGKGAALGAKAWDDHAGIEICFGSTAAPLDRETWHALLPGGWRRAAVLDLARLYVRDHCQLRLRLIVAGAAIQPVALGPAQPVAESTAGPVTPARLGQTAFLVTRPATAPRSIVCEGATA